MEYDGNLRNGTAWEGKGLDQDFSFSNSDFCRYNIEGLS